MRLLAAIFCLATALPAQIDPSYGQGWLPEFDVAAKRTLQLAEATPAEKYSWRPAPGVRSTGEVFMHIAMANVTILQQAGVDFDFPLPIPKGDPAKLITKKEDIILWLKTSFDLVRTHYPKADRQKKVQFLGQPAIADGVFLRLVVHVHEHHGQSIAYARMNGVTPPWSE